MRKYMVANTHYTIRYATCAMCDMHVCKWFKSTCQFPGTTGPVSPWKILQLDFAASHVFHFQFLNIAIILALHSRGPQDNRTSQHYVSLFERVFASKRKNWSPIEIRHFLLRFGFGKSIFLWVPCTSWSFLLPPFSDLFWLSCYIPNLYLRSLEGLLDRWWGLRLLLEGCSSDCVFFFLGTENGRLPAWVAIHLMF